MGLLLTVFLTGCTPTLLETLATGAEEENEPSKGKDEPSCYDWVQIPGYRVGEYKIAFKGRETIIGGNLIPGTEKLYRRSDYNTFEDYDHCFHKMSLGDQLSDTNFEQYLSDTLEWEDWSKYRDGLYDFSGSEMSGSLGKYELRERDLCNQHFTEKSNELLGKLCNQN